MMNANQLIELIIKPALGDLQLYSESAVQLLAFTCATESHGGTYLKQIKGPALGIFQMEPITYNDIWVNYIHKKQSISLQLIHNFDCNTQPPEDRMVYDLRFAAAMARIFYARIPEKLPDHNDLDAIWRYYKQYYNTPKGKAEYHEATNAYYRFMNL